MTRIPISVLVLLLFVTSVTAADDEGEKFAIANDSEHATAVRVIGLDTKPGKKFAVAGPDGEHVPAWYDRKEKQVLVLSSVPAGGGEFTLLDGEKSKADMPDWDKPKIKKEGKIKLGKTVTRYSGRMESDMLEVSVPVDEKVHGRVVIRAKSGDYKLELSPLGAATGCVETEEIGNQVDESYRQGQRVHDEVFVIYPSTPTEIEVLEPNPFQRVMRVECYAWARKNNGDTLDLFDEVAYEITLTWGSPVVKIRTWRKQNTTYYNHNGVNLNEVYIDQQPPQMQCDAEEAMTERRITGKVLTIEFEKAMRLGDKTGETVIFQPDFKNLAVYRECVVLAQDRIMTVLSQSWHEGWKPIEIPEGDYEDTMTLVCDIGASKKSLADWVGETE